MKKLVLALFVIAAVTVLTNKLVAQNPIPSFNVPVIVNPTTFEEISNSSSNLATPFSIGETLFSQTAGKGEVKLNIEATDKNNETTASAIVEIYSLDTELVYGPYTVVEGTIFTMFLSDKYEWGVRTLFATSGCELSTWFD